MFGKKKKKVKEINSAWGRHPYVGAVAHTHVRGRILLADNHFLNSFYFLIFFLYKLEILINLFVCNKDLNSHAHARMRTTEGDTRWLKYEQSFVFQKSHDACMTMIFK